MIFVEQMRENQFALPGQSVCYEEEIDLRDLLLTLWRYRKLIVVIFLLAVVVSSVVSFLLPPVYEVKSLVSLGSVTASNGQTVNVISPAAAKEMLMSDDLFREAVEKAGLDLANPTVGYCRKGLKAEAVKDTNFVRITIETGDPVVGMKILNELVDVFKHRAASGFDRQMELTKGELKRIDAELKELDKNIESTKKALEEMEKTADGLAMEWERARLLDSLSRFQEQRNKLLDKKFSLEQVLNTSKGIEVVEEPSVSAAPVRPRKKLNIAVSGVLGLMVGTFAAFALDYFRRNPLNLDEN
ncbi:MAG: Wzz/FepE/Etk N-terminal domain-containing protein [Thermacetogeniaceae bacterium]